VDAKLRSLGMATWFDATMMKGDINAAMTDGIDRSKTVVVFVTRNYLIKAAGLGPNGLGDNCAQPEPTRAVEKRSLHVHVHAHVHDSIHVWHVHA